MTKEQPQYPRSQPYRDALVLLTLISAQGAFLAPAFHDKSNALKWIVWGTVLAAGVGIVAWMIVRTQRNTTGRTQWWPGLTVLRPR